MPRRTLYLTAALTAVTVSACGSSVIGATGTNGSSSNGGAFLAFAKCMRVSGVPNYPDPGGANGGGIRVAVNPGAGETLQVNGVTVKAPAFHSAMTRCQSKLPNGGPKPSATQIAQLRKTALQQAQCMRAHGVSNFPDPKIATGPGGRIGIDQIPGISQQESVSPAFLAASKVCMAGGFTVRAGGG